MGLHDLFFADLVQALAPPALRPVYLLDWMRLKALAGPAVPDGAAMAAVAFHRMNAVHKFPGNPAKEAAVLLLKENAAAFLGDEGKAVARALRIEDFPAHEAAIERATCGTHAWGVRRFYQGGYMHQLAFCTRCLAAGEVSRAGYPPMDASNAPDVPPVPFASAVAHELGIAAEDHGFMAAFARHATATMTQAQRKRGAMPVTTVAGLLAATFERVFSNGALPPDTLWAAVKIIADIWGVGDTALPRVAPPLFEALDEACKHPELDDDPFVDVDGTAYKITYCKRCGRTTRREKDLPAMPEVERGTAERSSVITFRATPELYKDFKAVVVQLGSRSHGETVAALVSAAKRVVEAREGGDRGQDAARRALYAAVAFSGARIEATWGIPFTLIKIAIAEADAMEFKLLKGRLRVKTNEAMVELLLAVAKHLARGAR